MNRRLWLATALLLAAAPAVAEWRRDNREECDRVDAKLTDIEARRRAGYTASEGRKLQAQRDKLEQKRREKCR